jgi:DNA-binding XRE family transcriptional regulator
MTPDNFRSARKSLGLTQAQWAEWLGVKRNTIARIETGKREANPTMILLVRAYVDGWRPRIDT